MLDIQATNENVKTPTAGSQPRFRVLSFEAVVFFIYACVVGVTAFNHESWRDEAQSWLVARDLPFWEILQHIHYEGTPALWHMILMPFAQLGAPYEIAKVIHVLIALCAVAVFLRHAPFSRLTRVLFIFSYYMLWEYSIIARNYNLTVLWLFLLASMYRERFDRPLLYCSLLVLLFNSNVHSFGLATALSGLYLWELGGLKKRLRLFVLPLTVLALGVAAMLFQIWPVADNMRSGLFAEVNWLAPYRAIMNAFFPLTDYVTFYADNVFVFAPLVFTAIFILFFYGNWLLKHYPRLFVVFLAGVGWILYLVTFKYAGGFRHHGFILVFLLFLMWLSGHYAGENQTERAKADHVARRTLNLILFLGVFSGVAMIVIDNTRLYSGSKLMAAWLNKQDLSHIELIGSPSQATSSIAPYMPGRRFWYPETGKHGTFITWNTTFRENRNPDFNQVEQRVADAGLADQAQVWLILNKPVPAGRSQDYELLYKVDDRMFNPGDSERYYLYRMK